MTRADLSMLRAEFRRDIEDVKLHVTLTAATMLSLAVIVILAGFIFQP